MSTSRPTFAQIDLDALSFNFHSIKNFVGEGVKVMAVVKADAYGHGALECSRRLETEGVDWLAVALVEEAIELRNAGSKAPILCFGSFWPGQESELIENEITPVIFDLERANILNSAAKASGRMVDVHIKIDTGMGRVGVPYRELSEWSDSFLQFKNLNVSGLMTHFASADDLHNEMTNSQMRLFAEAVSVFHERGFRPTILDMANSPGAVAFKDSRASLVRIGGILYGLGDDVLPKEVDKPELKPVMSLSTKISLLKSINKGDSIGYGQTFIAARDSIIGTLPIGYNDGVPRVLSNKGEAIVSGQIAPIVGRVSMDWTTIDVTEVDGVKAGDKVIIIGRSDSNQVTAESIAAKCDTISYEITCGIGKRVPRVYVPNNTK